MVQESNPSGGRDFVYPSKSVLGPNQPPVQWALGSFPGGTATRAWN